MVNIHPGVIHEDLFCGLQIAEHLLVNLSHGTSASILVGSGSTQQDGDAGVADITSEIIRLRIHLDQVKMHKLPEEEGFGFNSIQFPLIFRKFLKKDRLIFEDI